MFPVRFAKSLIFGMLICVSLFAQTTTPTVVYETSTNYSGKYHQSTNEYGDEIILFGNTRVVTQIQFEYFSSFIPLGDELGRVRFYENTGPAWRNNNDYKTPAAPPLWETTFPVGLGFNTVTLAVPFVTVPLRFTWTVQFFGIAMIPGDQAGLLIYGDPIVGSSFNDYWELTRTGWTPLRYSEVPKNNFAAKILAISTAPPPPSLSAALEGGNLRISWPASATGFYLESRSAVNAGVWEPVTPLALQVGDVFQTSVLVGAGNRVFRLNTHPQPPVNINVEGNSVRVRWSSAIGGQTLQTKSALGATAWTDVPTPSRPTGDYYQVSVPIGTGAQFFRLVKKL